MATIKSNLLIEIDSLKNAVEKEDVEVLIHLIDDMGFDNRKSSMIVDFAKQIIINFISDYIKEKDIETLRISRTGEYGTKTYDTYKRCKEELFRNGTNVQWTSLGKLYQAYKYIKYCIKYGNN
jgi:bisphosphoglycerate-independent phosphoglycerate mutase (AlkP superfamily)